MFLLLPNIKTISYIPCANLVERFYNPDTMSFRAFLTRHNSGTNHDNQLSILTRGVTTSGGNDNGVVFCRFFRVGFKPKLMQARSHNIHFTIYSY